jgi:hypothetical protein
VGCLQACLFVPATACISSSMISCILLLLTCFSLPTSLCLLLAQPSYLPLLPAPQTAYHCLCLSATCLPLPTC